MYYFSEFNGLNNEQKTYNPYSPPPNLNDVVYCRGLVIEALYSKHECEMPFFHSLVKVDILCHINWINI